MNISMFNASVPTFIRQLKNLNNILDKAIAFAAEKKIADSVMVGYRLAPDMLPFSMQIQIASDNAKGCGARLAGITPPKFEDNEKTLPELKARIEKTIAFLETLKAEQIDGSEARAIEVKFPSITLNFNGINYLNTFALPNFYFHMTTAYAILRHMGVPVGKMDFLGNIA